MSVAVSCNLSEGVVLGVDSAVTLSSPDGVVKVFENSQKLFQLGELRIGVAIYGLATLGYRSVASYIREFEQKNPNKVLDGHPTMSSVVEGLRAFFLQVYRREVIPLLEQETGKKFPKIPKEQIHPLGLVVGGFSDGAFLPEVWSVILPRHSRKGSAECQRKQGKFGTNWFAMFGPIRRYIKGWEPQLIDDMMSYFEVLMGRKMKKSEKKAIGQILDAREYVIPFQAMPIAEGVEHTRFLVELVVNHHRFALGAPVVGGKVMLGKVTYKGEPFEILDEGKIQ